MSSSMKTPEDKEMDSDESQQVDEVDNTLICCAAQGYEQ
jgi:hypothetical protein